jgi:ribosome-associated heat shock protein Hsp15
LELLKLSKEHYRKNGTGRPTKKDRRDIDEFGNTPPLSSPKERGEE